MSQTTTLTLQDLEEIEQELPLARSNYHPPTLIEPSNQPNQAILTMRDVRNLFRAFSQRLSRMPKLSLLTTLSIISLILGLIICIFPSRNSRSSDDPEQPQECPVDTEWCYPPEGAHVEFV